MPATLLDTTFVGWDNGNADATTTVTSASITPGANCLIVAMLSEIGQNTNPFASTTPTSSGSGPTFTVVEKQGSISSFAGASGVWTGVVTSDPGSFTVSATYGNVGGSFTIYLLSIYKVTGYDTGTPTGGKEVTTGQAGNGQVTITLDAAPASGDITLAQCLVDENSTNKVATFSSTFGTWTTDEDGAASAHQLAYNVGQRTGSTSTSVDWSDVNSGTDNFGSTQVAVVVKMDSGGITGTASPTLGAFSSSASGTFADWTTFDDGVSATPGATVTGLTNGVTYEFRVAAVNAVGTGPTSNVVEETPQGTEITGSLAETLGPFTSSASGTFTPPPITGTVAETLDPFTSTATGVIEITGSAAVTLGPFVSAQPHDTPFPTTVDPVNRKLLDQFGEVYNMPVFSSWGFAMRMSDADLTTALEGIAALGWKCINVSIGGGVNVQSDWNAVQYENLAGQDFWTGTPWASSLGAAWSTVDHIQAETERLGMTFMMSFFVSFGTSGIGPDIEAVTNAQMRTTGQNIANRYIDAPNIVWEVEVDDGMTASSTRGRRIDYLFRGITETETTPRLQFVEPLLNGTAGFEYITGQGTDPTGYEWFHISADAMYSYEDNSVDQIEAVWGDHTSYPVWDSEPPYAAATHYGGNNNQQMRERNYSVFIEGFCAINYGDEDWWRVDKTGFFTRGGGFDWQDVLTATETIQAGYAWGIVDTYCNDLTWQPTSAFVTTGEGTGDTKAAQGASDTSALAYFPNNRTIEVDTTIIAGTGNVRLRWFDPVLGTFSSIATSEAQQTGRSVTLPAARGDGTRDFVLVVDEPPPAITGTVAVTLGSFTSTASGQQGTVGTVAETLDPFTSTASGTTQQYIGSVAETLDPFTSNGSGTFTPAPISGSVAETLDPFTSTASGTVVAYVGSVAETLDPFTSNGLGAFIPAGSGSAAITLAPFTSTASGTFTPPPITGTVAETLGPFVSTASGSNGSTGGDLNITFVALSPTLVERTADLVIYRSIGAPTIRPRSTTIAMRTRTPGAPTGVVRTALSPSLRPRTTTVTLRSRTPGAPTLE